MQGGGDSAGQGGLAGQPQRPPRPHGGFPRVKAGLDEWGDGNPNRDVIVDKVVLAPVVFTTEFGFVKTKNAELDDHYDTLYSIREAIAGAKGVQAKHLRSKAIEEFFQILEKVAAIREEIRSKGELAQPVPKKLAKFSKKLKVLG